MIHQCPLSHTRTYVQNKKLSPASRRRSLGVITRRAGGSFRGFAPLGRSLLSKTKNLKEIFFSQLLCTFAQALALPLLVPHLLRQPLLLQVCRCLQCFQLLNSGIDAGAGSSLLRRRGRRGRPTGRRRRGRWLPVASGCSAIPLGRRLERGGAAAAAAAVSGGGSVGGSGSGGVHAEWDDATLSLPRSLRNELEPRSLPCHTDFGASGKSSGPSFTS